MTIPNGQLEPCPFCGTANAFRDHSGNDKDARSGRTITCRESTCQAYMFRAQCWHDDAHTRLDTVEEMDAALAERWNRRPATSPSGLREAMESEEKSIMIELRLLDYNLLNYDTALKALTDKFLAWPLPKSVCSDLCATNNGYEHPRYGTNLLNADEARSMISDVFLPHLWQVVRERERFRAALLDRAAKAHAAAQPSKESLLDAPTLLAALESAWQARNKQEHYTSPPLSGFPFDLEMVEGALRSAIDAIHAALCTP